MDFFIKNIFFITALLPTLVLGQSVSLPPSPVINFSPSLPPLPAWMTPKFDIGPRPLTSGQRGTCQLIRERYDPPAEWHTKAFESEEKKLEELRKNPVMGVAKCSGAALSRNTFFTAAHCVEDILKPKPYYKEISKVKRELVTPKVGWVIIGRILCNEGKEQHLFWKNSIEINEDFYKDYSLNYTTDSEEYKQFCEGRSPALIKKSLAGVQYPASVDNLYRAAQKNNALAEVFMALQTLPHRQFGDLKSVNAELEGKIDLNGLSAYFSHNCPNYESHFARWGEIKRIKDDQAFVKTYEPFGSSCPGKDCVPLADIPDNEFQILTASYCEAYGYSGLDAEKGNHAHYAKMLPLDKVRMGEEPLLKSLIDEDMTIFDIDILQFGFSNNVHLEDSGGPIYCSQSPGSPLIMVGTIANIMPFHIPGPDGKPILKKKFPDGEEMTDGAAFMTRGASLRRLTRKDILQRLQRNEP